MNVEQSTTTTGRVILLRRPRPSGAQQAATLAARLQRRRALEAARRELHEDWRAYEREAARHEGEAAALRAWRAQLAALARALGVPGPGALR